MSNFWGAVQITTKTGPSHRISLILMHDGQRIRHRAPSLANTPASDSRQAAQANPEGLLCLPRALRSDK